MITKECFMKGIIDYADQEIMPRLPAAGKWGIGTAIILAKNKANTILDTYMQNDIIKALGVVNEQGLIDCNCLFDALIDSAAHYGKLDITIPVIGTMSFSDKDILKLKQYMSNYDNNNAYGVIIQ